MTIQQLLRSSIQRLKAAGIDSPSLDAELLLARALGAGRPFIIAHRDAAVAPGQAARFRAMLSRRARREPLAYITGEKEFYGYAFLVNRAVLIPRPETEFLVEAALDAVAGPDRHAGGSAGKSVIIDVGTGSGCVAVSVAKELEKRSVGHRIYALDISARALVVARRNIRRHNAGGNVTPVKSDLFAALPAAVRADAVVSNPPYVERAAIDGLQPEIGRYEPRLALDGGDDGLDFYRKIVPAAKKRVKKNGALILEIGDGQETGVSALLEEHGFIAARTVNDYSGVSRVITARLDDACR